MMDWVPYHCNANAEFYVKTLQKLRECVRKKKVELWNTKCFVTHHNNALSHRVQLVETLLEKIICSSFRMPPIHQIWPLRFFSFSKTEIGIERATSIGEVSAKSSFS